MFNYSSLNDKFIEFQEKIKETIKETLITLFFLSTYVIMFIFINICIFYR